MLRLSLVGLRRFGAVDELMSSAALLLMVLIPLWEILMRPLAGSGIQNAPVLVEAGADFLAVAAGVWEHGQGPQAAVKAFNAIF